MLPSRKPVVSICAVRTGAGKSLATRRIAALLRHERIRVVVVHHLNRAAELIDPRPYAVGSIRRTLGDYPHIGRRVWPAMGYGRQQMKDLEDTIDRVECDVVLIATPVDLGRVIRI